MRHLVRGIFGGLFVGSIILGTVGTAFYDYFKTLDQCPEHRWQVVLLGVGIGGSIGSFIGLLFGWTRLRRFHRLERLAYSESAEFIAEAGDRLTERAKALLGKLGTTSLRDVMKLVEADRRTSIWIGDLSVATDSNRHVERKTIAAFQHAGLSLPQFILRPRRFTLDILATVLGLQEIHFASYPGFSDTYHLSGSAEHLVTELFDTSLLDHFSAQDGFEIGGNGDWLVVAAPQRGHLSAANRKLFSIQALRILSLFAAACRDLDTSAVPQETRSATTQLNRLLPVVVSDSDASAFLEQPVPRSVPKRVARPHLLKALILAIFAAFFLAAGCFSIVFLFLAPITEAVWFAAIPLSLGSLLLWAAWRMRRNRLRLLSHGQVTSGFVQSVTRVTARFSQSRFRVEIRYEAVGTPTTGVVTVSGDIIEEVWNAQEQDRQVPLIYDPHAPQHCLLTRQLSTSWNAHPSMRKPPDAPGG